MCQRIPVYWGGYSAVEATVQLLRAALLWEGQPFDRFVLLQGLDYPIRTNREIHAFLEEKAETEFLLAQNISQCADPHETHKYSLYWFLDSKTKLWAKIWHKANSVLFFEIGSHSSLEKELRQESGGRKNGHLSGLRPVWRDKKAGGISGALP
ncbi:MAG: beta-1,6-N-acetylglucosaminyltransferase [Lachnospiraceae bacterium]